MAPPHPGPAATPPESRNLAVPTGRTRHSQNPPVEEAIGAKSLDLLITRLASNHAARRPKLAHFRRAKVGHDTPARGSPRPFVGNCLHELSANSRYWHLLTAEQGRIPRH